jgi:L-alanine-DL-glutamate epimerase-like enolase superfamily enzyme
VRDPPDHFELKPIENPMRHESVSNPIQHMDGWIYAPEVVGLGVDVNEDVVQQYLMR